MADPKRKWTTYLLRLRADDLRAVRRAARATGLTVADYIRRKLGLEEVEK